MKGDNVVYATSTTHFDKLLQRVAEFQKAGKYVDINLTIQNESGTGLKYKSHKCILAASSHYFRSMFTTGTAMGTTNEVEIKGIQDDGFKILFDYMLTGKLVYETNKSVVLLQTADFLQVDRASEAFMKHVLRYDLTLNQALDMAELASATMWRELEEKCITQISKNCNTYLQKPLVEGLLKLSYAPTLNLFIHESNESKEEDILEFIFKWLKVNHNKVNETEIKNLLGSVRYPFISDKNKFSSLTASYSDVVASSAVSQWVNEVKKFMETEDKTSIPESISKPREGSYHYLLFLCKKSETVFIYDVHKKAISKLSDAVDKTLELLNNTLGQLEMKKLFISLELTNGCLAGVNTYPKDDIKLPAFVRYENQTWHKQYRTQLALSSFIQLEYRIANIGGYDPFRSVDLCGAAMYGEGPWTLFKEMNVKRSEHALVYQAGIVYSIGGQNSTSGVLNSVEYYQLDPRGEEWKFTSNMLYARQGHKAVFLMNKILVVGGYKEKCNECKNSAKQLIFVNEWYDLNTQKWSEVPAIGDNYHVLGLVACNAKAYAIVSPESEKESLEIYSFCPNEMRWTKESDFRDTVENRVCYSTKFSAYDVSLI